MIASQSPVDNDTTLYINAFQQSSKQIHSRRTTHDHKYLGHYSTSGNPYDVLDAGDLAILGLITL